MSKNREKKMGKRNACENNDDQCTPFKKQKLLQSPPSLTESSIKQDFVLTRDLVDNTILQDLMQTQWRTGKPIGKKKKVEATFALV